jgi:hypothetical protein
MAYNIRPLSFAEVLDRSFQVLRDNFALLVGISLIVWVPYGVLTEFMSQRAMLPLTIVAALFLWILVPLATGAATFAIADVYLGRETTIAGAYQSLGSVFGAFIGTGVLMGLLLAVGFILLVVPGFYFMVCWYFVIPVMVIERRFGMHALGRSRAMVRGNWWPTFGIMLAAGLIAYVPSYAVNLIWSYLPVLGPLLRAVTQGVLATYPVIVTVVYYIDRRCRLEDFDLRLLAEQIRAEGAPGVAASAPAPTIG